MGVGRTLTPHKSIHQSFSQFFPLYFFQSLIPEPCFSLLFSLRPKQILFAFAPEFPVLRLFSPASHANFTYLMGDKVGSGKDRGKALWGKGLGRGAGGGGGGRLFLQLTATLEERTERKNDIEEYWDKYRKLSEIFIRIRSTVRWDSYWTFKDSCTISMNSYYRQKFLGLNPTKNSLCLQDISDEEGDTNEANFDARRFKYIVINF
ncbi:hypothetical protein [Effusibacillus consociatus]|uniref:Uncharacterized protein n=1 Tax=Effusibacillus consociatus TaxID=1117041 RepID=A0ABV9Q091_9BACL